MAIPDFENTVIIDNLQSISFLDRDSAKEIASTMRDEALDKLFNYASDKLHVTPDFALDGINQHLQPQRFKAKHIIAELVDNCIDALTKIVSDDIDDLGTIELKRHKPLISISIAVSDERVEFSVSDNGDGFPKEFLCNLAAGEMKSTKASGTTALMGGAGAGINQLIETGRSVSALYSFTNDPNGGARVTLSIPKSKVLTPDEYEQQEKERTQKKMLMFGTKREYIADKNGKFVPIRKEAEPVALASESDEEFTKKFKALKKELNSDKPGNDDSTPTTVLD